MLPWRIELKNDCLDTNNVLVQHNEKFASFQGLACLCSGVVGLPSVIAYSLVTCASVHKKNRELLMVKHYDNLYCQQDHHLQYHS